MGKEMAGARMKKRPMGASRKGKKMAAAQMMMPPTAPMAMKKGGMACGPKGAKKGGMALMIVLGKGDGKKKSK
jgi:hypothetical protein